MSNKSQVVLILGAGSNVGQNVAQSFASKGYKVALVARSANEEDNNADQVNIRGDFSDPDSVVSVFSKVKESLGVPSIVIYNAGASTSNDKDKPLSLSKDLFTRDLTINTTSVFVAAQQSVLGFEQLPESASRTFIYTGNCLNTAILPGFLTLGVGKTATAHIIETAAAAYKDRGFKFYYADERNADGSPAYLNINGEAHGKLYAELAEGNSQGPWQQTFVKGVGYKQFPAA